MHEKNPSPTATELAWHRTAKQTLKTKIHLNIKIKAGD